MNTIRLFKEDVYMRNAQATVTSVTEKSDGLLVTLDRTVFFPEGGGQSCDTGTINGMTVDSVYEYDDEIWHHIKCGKEDIKKGDTAILEINWDRRFDNMQRHCGEHILSGIFHREFGGVNRGFHMGDNYMTIDISLENDPSYTEITWQMAKHAELEANKVIWQDLPVISRHFDDNSQAMGLPLRKALAIKKDITIVCVGSPDEPSDCVACCGTHPSTAGQVGMIKIYKVEPNKGMFRIYFESGKRALQKASQHYDTLMSLAVNLSAGEDDVTEKFHSQQEKNKAARTQLHLLKKEIIRRESENLISSIHQDTSEKIPVRYYDILSPDDLASIGRASESSIQSLAFLVHKPTNTVFLCSSGSIDCGKLVKENASIYGGRGGGNKTLARAIFAKEEYVPVFMDLIEKHLRK